MNQRSTEIRARGPVGLGKSDSGFSIVGALIAVGFIGLTGFFVIKSVVSNNKIQAKAELKMVSTKFQDALIAAIADRAREFFRDDCNGSRWGKTGSPEVGKAFSTLKIDGPDGQTGSLSFIKAGTTLENMSKFSNDISRCKKPVGPANLTGGGQYAYFCMQFNRDPADSPGNKNSFWSMDGAVAEITLLPVDLVSDAPINCNQVRGARAGVKVQWRTYGVFENQRIDTNDKTQSGFRSSGIFLISGAGTEDFVTPTCTTTASRTATAGFCSVTVTKTAGEIYTVSVAGANLPRVSLSTWSGTVPCATGKSVLIAPSAVRPGGPPIACTKVTVPK